MTLKARARSGLEKVGLVPPPVKTSEQTVLKLFYSIKHQCLKLAAYLDCVEFSADVDENVVHVGDMVFKPFNLLIVHLHFAEKRKENLNMLIIDILMGYNY